MSPGKSRQRDAPEHQGDAFVIWLAWFVGACKDIVEAPTNSLLRPTLERLVGVEKGTRWAYFNYVHVLLWGVILGVAFCLTNLPDPPDALLILFVAFAVLRLAQILLWYLQLLLWREHRLILSPERNLVFLLLDIGLVVTALTVLLQVSSRGFGWTTGLSIVTLNGGPNGGLGVQAITVAGTFAGLLMVGAGLAIVVELLASKIRPGSRAYTGPVPPKRPYHGNLEVEGQTLRVGRLTLKVSEIKEVERMPDDSGFRFFLRDQEKLEPFEQWLFPFRPSKRRVAESEMRRVGLKIVDRFGDELPELD